MRMAANKRLLPDTSLGCVRELCSGMCASEQMASSLPIDPYSRRCYHHRARETPRNPGRHSLCERLRGARRRIIAG